MKKKKAKLKRKSERKLKVAGSSRNITNISPKTKKKKTHKILLDGWMDEFRCGSVWFVGPLDAFDVGGFVRAFIFYY